MNLKSKKIIGKAPKMDKNDISKFSVDLSSIMGNPNYYNKEYDHISLSTKTQYNSDNAFSAINRTANNREDPREAIDSINGELPILEELDIDVNLIIKKIKSVFYFSQKIDFLEDSDLSGPLFITICLGISLIMVSLKEG